MHFHRFKRKEKPTTMFLPSMDSFSEIYTKNYILYNLKKKRDNLTVSLNSTSGLGELSHF